MRYVPAMSAALLALTISGGELAGEPIEYPVTPTNHHEDVFEIMIEDPYRWLEADVRESPQVADWVAAQNELTFGYLEKLPGRSRITERLTALWNFERYGVPVQAGGRYFYRRNDGLQNQSVLYVQSGLEGEPRVLIDPNTWSADGATALADFEPSPDGSHVAYTVQDGGSDWRTIRVIDVASGRVLDDLVEWAKYTALAWVRDGSGFYYSRYPEPDKSGEFQALTFNQAVYFHVLGTPQSRDTLVYSRPEAPAEGFLASVTDDGRWLVITVWRGTDDRYEIVVKDLTESDTAPMLLIGGFENDYALVGNAGKRLYFRTDRNAPRSRIVAMDIDHPEPDRWLSIVPESAATLVEATLVGERIVARYLDDAKTVVHLFELSGRAAGPLELPGIGTAEGFAGRAGDSETFFVFSSFNAPPAIYRVDVASGARSLFRSSRVDFDPQDYVVSQVFYSSRDGTRVPMFITHRRGLERNGRNPTLLYGYGGFNQSITPAFSVSALAWMELGGVYAVANLRGGGEYGKTWHDAGRLDRKQNVFDDFIAAADYLIEQGYTSSRHLGIHGRSNGGLLVGAVVNQRPDLFAAAIPSVGVMDMLRFNQFTAGRFWVDDYGDPGRARDLRTLLTYSPYHNIRPGTEYPAVLVTTADTDDRVVPGHSFKYAARLQTAQKGRMPILIRIETRAGHGAGTPTGKLIEEWSDILTFLAHHTGMNLRGQGAGGRG